MIRILGLFVTVLIFSQVSEVYADCTSKVLGSYRRYHGDTTDEFYYGGCDVTLFGITMRYEYNRVNESQCKNLCQYIDGSQYYYSSNRNDSFPQVIEELRKIDQNRGVLEAR